MTDSPKNQHHAITDDILRLFAARGSLQYGKEAVSQLEHALQAAHFAEQAGASPALICAALVHDIGHLLHELPVDAPERGVDDRHEYLGAKWLRSRFGPDVVEPVMAHVAAKRYLCAADPDYRKQLSPPSVLSLALQGGDMSLDETQAFRGKPHFEASVALRRWDDAAKVPDLATPTLEHFATYLDRVLAN
jgi:phosphonate degradation associated HDIG domain protein